MRFTCNRSDFAKVVSTAGMATDQRSNIQILRNIKIEAAEQEVKIFAYNHRTGISIVLNANVDQPGAVTVDCSLLKEVIGHTASSDVIVEYDEEKSKLKIIEDEDNKYELSCLPVDDFPEMPDYKNGGAFTIPVADLVGAIKRTAFAANEEEQRAFMCGVYLFRENDELTFIATDGKRLAKQRVSGVDIGDSFSEKGILVPKRALDDAKKIFDGFEGSAAVSFNDEGIMIKTDNVSFLSRIIKVDFPDYSRPFAAINDSDVIRCKIDKTELKSKISGVVLMSKNIENKNLIMVTIDDEKMYLTAETQDVGIAKKSMKIEKQGRNISTNYSAPWILSYCDVASNEFLNVIISGETTPTYFEEPENGYVYLVMPIRL